MRNTLRTIVRTAGISGLAFVLPTLVHAEEEVVAEKNPSILGRLHNVAKLGGFNAEATDLSAAQFVGSIINAALALIGVIFFAQMVYAGYLWMTARGEKDQVEKAQDTIRRSVIGIVIVLAAWAVTVFVVNAVIGASGAS